MDISMVYIEFSSRMQSRAKADFDDIMTSTCVLKNLNAKILAILSCFIHLIITLHDDDNDQTSFFFASCIGSLST